MSIPQIFLDDPFLTQKDIQEILKVSRSTAFQKMHEMDHLKIGKCLRVRQSDFERWLEEKVKESNRI